MLLACSPRSLSGQSLFVFLVFKNMFYRLFKEDSILTSFKQKKEIIIRMLFNRIFDCLSQGVIVHKVVNVFHVVSDFA